MDIGSSGQKRGACPYFDLFSLSMKMALSISTCFSAYMLKSYADASHIRSMSSIVGTAKTMRYTTGGHEPGSSLNVMGTSSPRPQATQQALCGSCQSLLDRPSKVPDGLVPDTL